MPQKHLPSETAVVVDQPIPYKLAFRHGHRAAKLTSPRLDKSMHARGGVDVLFGSLSRKHTGGSVELDPFETRSLVAYLQNQDAVRRGLERELNDMLDSWDEEMKVGRGHDVWLQTKIAAVLFAPRLVATPDQIQHIKNAHKEVAQKILREEFDTSESSSSFAVMMRPEWAEHLLTVQFRDGEAMELKVEG